MLKDASVKLLLLVNRFIARSTFNSSLIAPQSLYDFYMWIISHCLSSMFLYLRFYDVDLQLSILQWLKKGLAKEKKTTKHKNKAIYRKVRDQNWLTTNTKQK